MSIPSFTAEASLYKTSAHYWTGRSAVDLRTQPNSAIYPAMMNEGNYTPNGCAPGKLFWGQIDGGDYGVDWGCIDNPVDGWGEDSSGGTGVGEPEGQPYGGGGGGGGSSSGKGKGPELQLPPGIKVCTTDAEISNYLHNYKKDLKNCNSKQGVVHCDSSTGNPNCCTKNLRKRKWDCTPMSKG